MTLKSYDNFAAQIGTASVIHGIQDQSFQENMDIIARQSDGEETVRFTGARTAAPGVSLQTCHVEQALDIIGVEGAETPAEESSIFSWSAKTEFGGRSTVTGEKYTFTKGLFVPKTLACSLGQDAVLTVDYLGLSADGEACPYTRATQCASIDLTGVTELFTIGKVKLGAVELGQLKDLRIDFGLILKVLNYKLYPTAIFRDTWIPIITMTSDDLSLVSTIGATGATGVLLVFLQQRTNNGGLEAAASAKHIKLTLEDAYVTAHKRGGAQGGDKVIEIQARGKFDGTNAPIAYAKDQAIS